MDSDLVYKIALSMTPGITADAVRALEANGVSFSDFFTLNMPELESRLGVGEFGRFQNIRREEALFRAREEAKFTERHSIRVLFLLDGDYPPLLREIPDAPVVLYVLGRADLSAWPAFNVVGTRRCTAYGTAFCETLVSSMAAYYPGALVISGLAYGIDAAAHTAALRHGLATAAVMAHGLDMVYPAPHRDLARRIIEAGGAIVSEYPSGTRPFQKNFLQRNRIVAGLSELTFVVESEIKGGAMSTANQAFSYGREVVALPGRYTDATSSGCNHLIARSKAHIFTSVADLMNLMGWRIPIAEISTIQPPQKVLFPELEGDLQTVYTVLRRAASPMSIDEIHMQTHMAMPSLMAALTDLEFEGIVVKLPGARYECS